MKTMTGYTVAVLCVVTFLGVAFAACDSADSSKNQAGAQEANAQAETVSDRPIARYDEGELMLAVSTDEAHETVMKTARKLIPDVEEVAFEEPVLQMVDNRPYLIMRGQRPDGNCAMAYVRLVSESALEAEALHSLSEARSPSEQDVMLFETPGGGSCTGDPCNKCGITSNEVCHCDGSGPGGTPGWCNHSTGG